MRRFTPAAEVQRSPSIQRPIQNLFRVARFHLKAIHDRLLRELAFTVWRAAMCAR